MRKLVTYKNEQVNFLSLGCFERNFFIKNRPLAKCWCCENDLTESIDTTLSCALTNSQNFPVCNECAIQLMKLGAEVRFNQIPKTEMRKYKVSLIFDIL